MGQWLSLPMIVLGTVIMVLAYQKNTFAPPSKAGKKK